MHTAAKFGSGLVARQVCQKAVRSLPLQLSCAALAAIVCGRVVTCTRLYVHLFRAHTDKCVLFNIVGLINIKCKRECSQTDMHACTHRHTHMGAQIRTLMCGLLSAAVSNTSHLEFETRTLSAFQSRVDSEIVGSITLRSASIEASTDSKRRQLRQTTGLLAEVRAYVRQQMGGQTCVHVCVFVRLFMTMCVRMLGWLFLWRYKHTCVCPPANRWTHA